MSRYHDRTFKLLGPEGDIKQQPRPRLLAWATSKGIALPAAYLEWAQFDHKDLLRKYSNDDSFEFDEPDIVVTPDGSRGLLFYVENQGNFSKIVLLDHDEDPPVLSAYIGSPPWIKYCDHFSDCVYAQIFDWQYFLEFNADGSKEMARFCAVKLRGDHVDALRSRFEETATTSSVQNNIRYTESRFIASPAERMTVITTELGTTYIRITGSSELIDALEIKLIEAFSEYVIPPSFNYLRTALRELSADIDRNRLVKLRHAFIDMPAQGTIDGLIAAHRELPLTTRFERQHFPKTEDSLILMVPDTGIAIRFRREDKFHWQILDASSL